MKKIVSIILCVILIFQLNIKSHASSSGNTFREILVDNVVGYTCDDSNLPSSGDYYFGLTSSGNVWYTTMGKAIPLILNRGLGVSLNPLNLVNFITDYVTYGIQDNPITKPVYNGNTRVGWALADLTGKTLVGSTGTGETADIPSTEVNNVYNYYNEWYVDNGYGFPDYINLETRASTFYANKLNNNDSYVTAIGNFLSSNDYTYCCMKYDSTTLTYSTSTASGGYILDIPLDNLTFIADDSTSTNTGSYKAFVNTYNVSSYTNQVPFTSMMLSSVSCGCYPKKIDDLSSYQTVKRVSYDSNGAYNIYNQGLIIMLGGYNNLPNCELPTITIYKDINVFNQFVNKTYAPVSFNTQQWYDYNENSDNSITTSTTEIDNSTTTNETIYNESAESFSEYYEENNYHIDNSITISNNTTIVNNYYGSDDNGGDDSGGGSGGGGDDSDGSLLDRLLNAILDFFKGIAKIITAILTGIFELFNSILETIANITTSFDGITNLFSAIFGWLPEPIINLMVLGLGLALLAAFITWFR